MVGLFPENQTTGLVYNGRIAQMKFRD